MGKGGFGKGAAGYGAIGAGGADASNAYQYSQGPGYGNSYGWRPRYRQYNQPYNPPQPSQTKGPFSTMTDGIKGFVGELNSFSE
eukprot:4919330-Karenia_brevis.AAC.1